MRLIVDKVMKLMATKLGLFLDVNGQMTVPARKRGVFLAAERAEKKRHPLKDVSVYGVEQGGTIEKPWPPVAS